MSKRTPSVTIRLAGETFVAVYRIEGDPAAVTVSHPVLGTCTAYCGNTSPAGAARSLLLEMALRASSTAPKAPQV
jgi:hypothetical protein